MGIYYREKAIPMFRVQSIRDLVENGKLKGALDKFNIIPNFFQKKLGFLYY